MSTGFGSEIVIIDEQWERIGEVLDLYYQVLYRDYGLTEDDDWFHASAGGELAVALGPDAEVLGAARLLPAIGDSERQLRQVAVRPESRGSGLGKALVATLEWRAADEGAETLWLNARESAIPFYERLGFIAEGEMFGSALTRLPHMRMRKRLRG
ncbi:MAG: GNAT family N-acetyltransferase [Coriobacteriales bacterium]|nr:GNAT family N-acetyltransferase [Coriobacteriales bacterium]